jgi:hypothetical protein
MSSSPSAKQWIVIILVNILVSSLTAYFVFRTLVTDAQPGEVPAAAASGLGAAETPAGAPSAAPPPPSPSPSPAAAAALDGAATPTPSAAPAAPTPIAADDGAVTATPAAATPVAASDGAAASTAEPAATAAAPIVRISAVLFPGQLAREVVVLVNQGDQVDLTGWVLSSSNGNTYTFGNVTLFRESFINLRSSSGADVPTDLYWNRSEPAFQAGDTLTLSRGSEAVATFSIPAR